MTNLTISTPSTNTSRVTHVPVKTSQLSISSPGSRTGRFQIINLVAEPRKRTKKKKFVASPPKPRLSSEERTQRLGITVFKDRLTKCVEYCEPTLINLQKNPKSKGALNRVRLAAESFSAVLMPEEDLLFRGLQDEILKPLKERIAKLKSYDLQAMVSKWMPIFPSLPPPKPEEKTDLRRTVTAQETAKAKRAAQAGGFPANFDLKTLIGPNGFSMKGLAARDYFGSSVSTAGDFNGDGIDDIVLGAALASPGGLTNAGSAFAVYGQRNGWSATFSLTNLTGINGWSVDGLAAGGALGAAVSTAGDFNGDGFDDIVLGAPSSSPGGLSQAGSVFVIYGNSTGFGPKFNLGGLTGINGWSVDGVAALDQLGQSVSKAGDINGDGIDDLVLGAYNASPTGHPNAGKVYVIFGQKSGMPAKFILTNLNGINGFVIDGILNQGYLGWSVKAAGDINGDGIHDLVLGAYYASPGGVVSAGTAYVIFGHTGPWNPSFNLTTLTGITGFAANGVMPNNFLGSSVSGAGDINGDGIDDLLLGGDSASPGGRVQAGSVFGIYGHKGVWISPFNLTALNQTTGFFAYGIKAGDILGNSVSGAGDINGDGIGDIVLGAYYASPTGLINAGMSSVILGPLNLTVQFNLTNLNGINGFDAAGLDVYDRLGSSVSAAGDFNGDGIGDLVLGAPGNGTIAGDAYVVFGTNSSSTSPTPAPPATGTSPTSTPQPTGTASPSSSIPPTGASSSSSTGSPSSSTPASNPTSTSSMSPTSTNPSPTSTDQPPEGPPPPPLSTGGIVGVVIGLALFVAGVITGVVIAVRRKKAAKKDESPFMHKVDEKKAEEKKEPADESTPINRDIDSRDSYRTRGSDSDKDD